MPSRSCSAVPDQSKKESINILRTRSREEEALIFIVSVCVRKGIVADEYSDEVFVKVNDKYFSSIC